MGKWHYLAGMKYLADDKSDCLPMWFTIACITRQVQVYVVSVRSFDIRCGYYVGCESLVRSNYIIEITYKRCIVVSCFH